MLKLHVIPLHAECYSLDDVSVLECDKCTELLANVDRASGCLLGEQMYPRCKNVVATAATVTATQSECHVELEDA